MFYVRCNTGGDGGGGGGKGGDRCQNMENIVSTRIILKKIELKSSKKLLGHGTEGYFIHTVRLVYPIDFYLIKKGGHKKGYFKPKARLCDGYFMRYTTVPILPIRD